MKVALCPKAYLHTLATGIVAKLLQVLDVAVQSTSLAITGTITVIGKEPAQGEVVVEITVDSSTGRELIVVLLAVQGFLHATVVLLALIVELAVLVGHLDSLVILFLLCPEVTVVGIQVSLIETELRQQNRITCQLIEVVQQGHGTLVDHHEDIQIICLVIKHGVVCLGSTEVIATGLEGVPHHAIASSAPIVRSGTADATIHPVVGVLDGNELVLVRETAVLHATAIEVIILILSKLHGCALLTKLCGNHLINNKFTTLDGLNLTSLCVHLNHNLLGC